MRKCIMILLALALLLGLCACGGETATQTEPTIPTTGLTVGYGRELIMPRHL